VNEPTEPHGDFVAAFESAFARFQVRVEEACATEAEWPQGVAAGIRATFEFAATEPADAGVLASKALAEGPDGVARHRRLVAYVSSLLEPGREEGIGSALPSTVLEHALVGGLVFLVAHRLAHDREGELPGLAPDATEFVLAPYLGADEARRIARARDSGEA
jgi:hypothetical protein